MSGMHDIPMVALPQEISGGSDRQRLAPSVAGNIKLGRLRQNHPRLNVKKVRVLKALYYGGSRLLEDREILHEIFPQYTHENPDVYGERCRRAFYENVFGMIINQISAGLAQDPIRPQEEIKPKMSVGSEELSDEEVDENDFEDASEEVDEDVEEEEEEEDSAIQSFESILDKIDPFWHQFTENATALSDDDSTRRTFDQVMRNLSVEAFVTGWAWAQAELPRTDMRPPVSSLKEQEDQGDLRAYVVPWPTECVTDWSEKDGHLNWVRTHHVIVPDDDPSIPRDTEIHQWTIWRADSWVRYELVKKPNQSPQSDDIELTPIDSGRHTFGRVPFVRLDVTGTCGFSLHIGDLLQSLATNYFNRQNGESFQWTQYFFQQLYEFLGPEIGGIDTPISSAQQDPSRAKRTRSPGKVHVRGNNDDARFVGPDMSGAEVGRKAMQDLREAMLRLVAQMALAQDTQGAMLRRSGDSKRQDSVAQEIVLGAIGKLLVVAANALVNLIAVGRGDSSAPPKFVGYQHFNVMDTEAVLNQSAVFATLNIPSARAQIEEAYQVAVAKLGDNATPAMLAEIRSQLEQAITQDQMAQGPPDGEPPNDDELDDLEDEDEDDESTSWDEEEDE